MHIHVYILTKEISKPEKLIKNFNYYTISKSPRDHEGKFSKIECILIFI